MLITYRAFICLCLSVLAGYSVSAQEEMEQLGPVRSKDALRAHGEMVSMARQLEEQGKMSLRMDEGDAFV